MKDRPPVSGEALATILKSQYHRALTMLHESIEKCPEDLWYSAVPKNAFWQVAYHALFFTHVYLQPNEEAFRPWSGHQSAVQYPDGIPGPADPNSGLPLNPRPYSKAEACRRGYRAMNSSGRWKSSLFCGASVVHQLG